MAFVSGHVMVRSLPAVGLLAVVVLLTLLGVDMFVADGSAAVAVESIGKMVSTAGTVKLSLSRTLLSGVVMIMVATVSYFLELGITAEILTAYVRCAGQLALLGFILTPILTTTSAFVVLCVMVAMLSIASIEVVSRLETTFPHATATVFACMGLGVGLNLLICLLFLEVHPIWAPFYAVPIWGMALGNSLTAVALALQNTVRSLAGDGLKDVESLLVHGASKWEATRFLVVEAVKKGLVPTINQMNVIGVVSLPGMVTGQLLGGASATQACYYQMLIMFIIAGSCCFSVLFTMVVTITLLTDDACRVRTDMLSTQQSGGDPLTRLCRFVSRTAERQGIFVLVMLVALAVAVVAMLSSAFGVFPKGPLQRVTNIAIAMFALCVPVLLLKLALEKKPCGTPADDEQAPLFPK
eukprot:TRINITY_DN2041_c0_g5_i1.p2 TRINITY_DN2041_c0_g5~~TRINITY_DN2041_c0_g5_i1.p2  ORF type:complete len:426 (+),score=157.79 TRINITY_DN2041_c0_g5_i1:46-1278(+)